MTLMITAKAAKPIDLEEYLNLRLTDTNWAQSQPPLMTMLVNLVVLLYENGSLGLEDLRSLADDQSLVPVNPQRRAVKPEHDWQNAAKVLWRALDCVLYGEVSKYTVYLDKVQLLPEYDTAKATWTAYRRFFEEVE